MYGSGPKTGGDAVLLQPFQALTLAGPDALRPEGAFKLPGRCGGRAQRSKERACVKPGTRPDVPRLPPNCPIQLPDALRKGLRQYRPAHSTVSFCEDRSPGQRTSAPLPAKTLPRLRIGLPTGPQERPGQRKERPAVRGHAWANEEEQACGLHGRVKKA